MKRNISEEEETKIKGGKSKFQIRKHGKIFSRFEFGIHFFLYNSKIYDDHFENVIAKTPNCYIKIDLFGSDIYVGLMNFSKYFNSSSF